jgi:hypothetical protein
MAEVLKFYDMKAKKAFTTGDYKIVTKSGRRFAIAKGKAGNDCWRVLGNK